MKAIVTGSQGFIGRHLVAYLRRRGHEVVGVDVAGEADVVRDVVERGLYGLPADALYHLAASPSRPDGREPERGGNNAALAGRVIGWADENPQGLVVFASTWMAGAAFCGYAKSKADAERILWRHVPHDRLRIVRLPNVFGPGGHGIVDILKRRAAAGEAVTIHGDGSQRRQFMHVDHVVEHLAAPLDAPLYQIEGSPRTIIGLAKSSGAKIEYAPDPGFGPELHTVPLMWDRSYIEKYLNE